MEIKSCYLLALKTDADGMSKDLITPTFQKLLSRNDSGVEAKKAQL